MRTQGEVGCLQAKGRGFRVNQFYWHLDLGLPGSRTVSKEIPVVSPTQTVVLCGGSPSKLIQMRSPGHPTPPSLAFSLQRMKWQETEKTWRAWVQGGERGYHLLYPQVMGGIEGRWAKGGRQYWEHDLPGAWSGRTQRVKEGTISRRAWDWDWNKGTRRTHEEVISRMAGWVARHLFLAQLIETRLRWEPPYRSGKEVGLVPEKASGTRC